MNMSKVCILTLNFLQPIQLNVIDSLLPGIVDSYWCVNSYGTSFDTSYDTSYNTSYDTSYDTSVLNTFLPPVMDSLQY
jgi:hypothetical protein